MKDRIFSLRIREAKIPGRVVFTSFAVFAMIVFSHLAIATAQKPNILAIFGDDIGWFNLSIYNHGIMGYKTPNLDRIGKEGGMFTDAYAEQSCTAGRAAFLTGQHGLRTGMIKVGLPGVPFGLSHEDPTIAVALKAYGYTTGQFGKNHLGDTNDVLPTTHGFDEFFGNLYHLNAEEEPENLDYPTDPEFAEKYGPRGVIHSYAKEVTPSTGGGKIDETTGQYIVDTGRLTTQRMKTIDGVFAREAIRFMDEAQHAGTPFFTWYAASRMHVWTHLKEKTDYKAGPTVPEFDKLCYAKKADGTSWSTPGGLCNVAMKQDYYAEGKTGLGVHSDGMVEHDMYAGLLLDYLDDAGLADNTIVIYTSDNGPETFTWPDGGTTPFRSEKATNWEGAYRVPLLVRWPGVIKPGFVSNEIIALQDWFPTLVSAASEAAGNRIDIKAKLKKHGGYKFGEETYHVHLDGYDFLDYFRCVNGFQPPEEVCPESPRKEFIYTNDDGLLVGMRYDQWKIVFHEQRADAFDVWQDPFTALRVPKIFNLRSDPFEKADHESDFYTGWRFNRAFLLTPAQVEVYKFLSSFKEFPPRQAPPSFSININVKDIIEKCGTVEEPLEDNSECFPLPKDGPHLPAISG